VARGNFEISAKWENGKASFFKIIAKSGGKCRFKYKGIEDVQIKDDNNKSIPYTIEGENIIEFVTCKTGEYVLSF
jgi:alpha-L-fucosidase 2